MNRIRKILRILLIGLAVLVGLFLVVWILVQTPRVQNYLVGKISGNLSKQLQTEVSVEKVDIKFFKTATGVAA